MSKQESDPQMKLVSTTKRPPEVIITEVVDLIAESFDHYLNDLIAQGFHVDWYKTCNLHQNNDPFIYTYYVTLYKDILTFEDVNCIDARCSTEPSVIALLEKSYISTMIQEYVNREPIDIDLYTKPDRQYPFLRST